LQSICTRQPDRPIAMPKGPIMTYRATRDVVQRVLPLIERMTTRSIDKALVLQYLSARAGVDWGVHELVRDEHIPLDTGNEIREVRHLTFRDRASGQEHVLRYPDCLARLPTEIEPLVVEEYKRLAIDRPLTMMAEPLFTHFFTADFCSHCRWQSAAHVQIQTECRFAGYPVNFESWAANDRTLPPDGDTSLG